MRACAILTGIYTNKQPHALQSSRTPCRTLNQGMRSYRALANIGFVGLAIWLCAQHMKTGI